MGDGESTFVGRDARCGGSEGGGTQAVCVCVPCCVRTRVCCVCARTEGHGGVAGGRALAHAEQRAHDAE